MSARSWIGAALVVAVAVAGLALGSPESASAAPWCGSVAATDRPQVVGGKPVRIVYAIPSDGNDQGAAFGGIISGAIDTISAWWRGQDASRSPRFDLAAFPCGNQADIVLLKLPRTAAELSPSDGRFEAIAGPASVFGPAVSSSKYLVFYDGPVSDPDLCGQAGGDLDGDGVAVVYLAACEGVPRETVAAHELVHAFGAVAQSGTPHTCPDSVGHVCDSSSDLMYPSASAAPLSALTLDVGHDDYYAHVGSWLDVQDSAWLRHLDVPPATLRVQPTGGGSVASDDVGVDCAAACAVEYDGGSRVALNPLPEQGKRFVSWSGACAGRNACSLTLTASATVAALFAPDSYRLTVSVGGKGSVRSGVVGISCPGRCAANAPSYTPLSLRAAPARGWKLARWSAGCGGRQPVCKVPMTAATAVGAEFVRK